MRTYAMVCAMFLISAMASSVHAQQASSPRVERIEPIAAQKVVVPGTGYEIVVGMDELRPEGTPRQALLKAIVAWLSTNFGLLPTDDLPQVKLAPATTITALRYEGFLANGPVSNLDQGAPLSPRQVIAVYDNARKTIYLPEGWTGKTPAELSVLVHEMVHHLQNLAKAKFECPQAREQLAYAAQDRWLGLFGRNLLDDFEIDGFTLLVSTRCGY